MSALRSPTAAQELTRSPECLALEHHLNDSISQIVLHSVIRQEMCTGCKSYKNVSSAFYLGVRKMLCQEALKFIRMHQRAQRPQALPC